MNSLVLLKTMSMRDPTMYYCLLFIDVLCPFMSCNRGISHYCAPLPSLCETGRLDKSSMNFNYSCILIC